MKQENGFKSGHKISFLSQKEFFEASEYYEEKVVGLGDDFINEAEKILNVIE